MNTGRKKIKISGKKKSHRKALIKSQVIELIRAQRIKTTPARAKALKRVFDRLVTEAKKDTMASERRVMAFFGNNKRATSRLYSIIKDKLSDRNSGYTRVIKTVPRPGDNAEQVYVMLVNADIQESKSRIAKVIEKQNKSRSGKTRSKEKQVKGSDKKDTGKEK
jgi:large subunit ribosomal protein L17